MGGYLSCLYASRHPQRIKALFGVSPAGLQTYNPEAYQPELFPDFDEPSKPLTKKMVKATLARESTKGHPFMALTKIKPEVAASLIENNCRMQLCTEDNPCTEAQKEAICSYQSKMFSRLSILETVEVMPLKFPFLVRHPMNAADRLGNPSVNFPIAFAFGDRDFFGSEGAEELVLESPQYKTKSSQLFRVQNCSHFMPSDQPEEMTRIVHGFFSGSITGTF